MNGWEETSQIVPASLVGLVLINLLQYKLNLSRQHALLLRAPLEQFLQEEESIRPCTVIEAIFFDHLL